jgi:ketosteroid isomerase-like protein
MQSAISFAKSWEEGWNSHDLDRIMKHYREDIVFRSRKAIPITGKGELSEKESLRAYWRTALERQPDLQFSVQDVFEGYRMAVITYTNHRGILASETLYFDDDGMVYMAAACHREEGLAT